MRTKTQDVVCLIRYGKKGELIVNGKNYNQPMPSFPALSDIEIAEITTYIYNSWGNEEGLFEVKKVSEILKQCNEE
jgi:mono/diheme cytochrome c family protein